MSWSLSKIVGLVIIPLMIAATILGAYQSIKTGPFEDQKGKTLKILRKEARHMKIGINDQGNTVPRQAAAEQFRGLVVYSQISAVNCKLLYYIHAKGSNGNKPSKYVSGDSRPSVIWSDLSNANNLIKYSIPSRPDGDQHSLFNYLAESDYVPTCIGTGNTIPSAVVDRRTQAIRKGDLIGIAYQSTVGSLIGGLQDLWNHASCKLHQGWMASRGNDMEGKFGKITFETERRIILRDNRVWSANVLWDENNCPANNWNILGPSFWSGDEWMNYVPYPDGSSTPKQLNYHINGQGVPFGETKSASMDAIIDAPIVTPNDLDDLNGGSGDDFPVARVNYVICKGAEGYVQTNAQNMSNDGESIWGPSPYENAGEYEGFTTKTFTFIRVQKNAMSCFPDSNTHIGGADYYGTMQNGESCNTFEEASRTPEPKRTGNYECGFIRDRWNTADGNLLTHVWQIGWTR